MDDVVTVALRLPPELANTLSALCDAMVHLQHEVEGLKAEVQILATVVNVRILVEEP